MSAYHYVTTKTQDLHIMLSGRYSSCTEVEEALINRISLISDERFGVWHDCSVFEAAVFNKKRQRESTNTDINREHRQFDIPEGSQLIIPPIMTSMKVGSPFMSIIHSFLK